MSDRPDQGPSGNTTRDGSNVIPLTTSPAPSHALQPTAGVRSVTSPTSQRLTQPPGRSFELPPLPQAPSTTGGSFSPSTTRLTGFSSILNPSQTEDAPQNRRRKASQLESPVSSIHSLPPIATTLQGFQPISTFPAPSPIVQHAAPNDQQPRRILTPRSPSLHRAASLGQLNSSAGTINAQRVPFPTSPRSRVYAIEPGVSGAPPLPTPPPAHRATYGFPAATPPTEAARRASVGTGRARALSSSASPSTSYSSYSHAGQTSPAAHYSSTSLGEVPTSYTTSGDNGFSGLQPGSAHPSTSGAERQRPMGIPISSSGGQNVYQMMTLETTSGTVQLPVDVQAASRVADEKRRRNAGASARFRQRRKEKEKEASTTISRLEQQVKDLGEDAEFYRHDRDILISILNSIPGGQRHLPRPTSPRNRRSSTASLPGPSGSGSAGFVPGQEQLTRSPGDGRNVRRRTSTFSLPPPQPQSQVPPHGPPVQTGYGPQTYGAPLAPQPSAGQQGFSGALPSPLMGGPPPNPPQMTPRQPQPPSGPPQVLHPTPQTGPWNPYPSERRPPGPPNQRRENR